MTDLEQRQIIPLKEADFALDGGAMFGIIPRPIWERTQPADQGHRIDLATRCLLIIDDTQTTLIDVGIGTRWSERHREIFKISGQDPRFVTALGRHGLTPEEIDHVILTHLHFDHVGGLSYLDEQGELRPSFPNATHWVQRRQWGWAFHPSPRDEGSFRPDDFAFLDTPDGPDLQLLDGPCRPLDGIELFPCDGHTFGMQIANIETPDQNYLYLADLIPTTSHFGSPYVMGYDLQPLETVKEKQHYLHRAMHGDWILLFEHDPTVAAGRVIAGDKGPEFAPLHQSPSALVLDSPATS